MRLWHFTALIALAGCPAWANIGRVKSASGGAVIFRGTEQVEAKPGVILEVGDTVRTPAGARIGITFVDNSRVSVSPGTELTLYSFTFDDTTQSGNFQMQLRKGEVAVYSGAISRSAPNAMLLRTAKSLYAIRDAKIVVRSK